MKYEEFREDITPVAALTEILDTTQLFGLKTTEQRLSPVDRYIENSNKLSKIYLNDSIRKSYTADLGSVLLLGHVSAVESYLRGLIRRLVLVDEHVQKLVASQPVTYAAAHFHEKELLPDALLEGISFISKKNVSSTLKDFCGITGMNDELPSELRSVFTKFNHICQLRHCCVHRFGLLGTNNALSLGIDKHRQFLESPLALSLTTLEEISSILQKFVFSLNSYIYKDILSRSFLNSPSFAQGTNPQYKMEWTLDFEADEKRFSSYYDSFAQTIVAPKSLSMWEHYSSFSVWATKRIQDEAKIRAQKQKAQLKK